MFKQWTYRDLLNNYLAFLVTLSIVLPMVFGIAVLPFLIILLVGWRRKLVYFRVSFMAGLFIALFIIYAVGLLLTFHDQFDPSILERKLSFLILPLLLSFHPKEGRYSMPLMSSALIVGVVLVGLYGVVNGMLCYLQSGNISCLLTVSISPVHHPSYFMTYVLTAMFLAWLGWHKGWARYSLRWILPFTLFGLILHFVSLSLAGILFFLLTAMVVVIYLIYRRFGIKTTAIGIAILPVVAYLIVTEVPHVEGEWNNAKWYADEYLKDPEGFIRNTPYPSSGSEQRLILWTVGWQQMKASPWGVGTGNLDEALAVRLKAYGQGELADKNMNPHNQFLQTGIEVGIVGLAVFLVILGYGMWIGIKRRNGLLLLLVTCLAFNSLFESMLQRQSGVVFFTLWICLAILFSKDEFNKLKA